MPGKTAIVTGGANGIGFACARRFLQDGYKVIIADQSDSAGQRAIADLAGFADDVAFIQSDVSDKLQVHNLIAETLSLFGQIDVLVNNAAVITPGGILDLDERDFDRVMGVNLRGAFLVSKYVARYMVEEIENRDDRSRLTEKPYAIINMSSINDTVAIPNYLSYVVSKGGLKQLTRGMALELAPYGIRVNAISPGSVKTDMAAAVIGDAAALKRTLSRTPLGRFAQPDEIASVASFLASDDASYITGECIYVDGGRLALNYTMPERETDE